MKILARFVVASSVATFIAASTAPAISGQSESANASAPTSAQAELASLASHCAANEAVMFSCKIENSKKVLSICQSPVDPTNVSYRFGLVGKPELTLPAQGSAIPVVQIWEDGMDTGAWSHNIEYRSGQVTYTIFHGKFSDGVLVESAGKLLARLVCDSSEGGGMEPDALDALRRLGFREKK